VAAFHAACHRGDEAAVRAALAASPALLRAPEPDTGFTPLVACLLGGAAAAPALRALKEKLAPGDLRALCVSGRSPLHFAAKAHSAGSDSLKWLLGASVPTTAADADGVTPLHEAVKNHHAPAEAVAMLVAAGADRGARDGKGRSPVDLAKVLGEHGVLPNADAVLAALGATN
jgi:ankyrin repeat protein